MKMLIWPVGHCLAKHTTRIDSKDLAVKGEPIWQKIN
jgi:hypothetical protein